VKQKSPIAQVWEWGESGHKQIIYSVILALLGVLAGIVPFICASKIVVMMIGGEREQSTYLTYILIGVVAYLLNTFLYTGALGISHKATFRILKEIRQKACRDRDL